MGANTPVYLGSGVPVPQRAGQTAAGGASSNSTSNGSTAGVKKWKNKLKTLLGAPSSQPPSPAAATAAIIPSPPGPSSASLSVSNSNNTSSSTATPRPSSPHETLHAAYHTSSSSSLSLPMSHSSSSSSKQASPANSNTFTATTTTARASTSTPVPSALLNSLSKSSLNDVYAGYDISVDYSSNHNNGGDLTISGGGEDDADTRANDSYEARLSRLVGDLENVDYSSFASFTNLNTHNASFGQLMAAHGDDADASGNDSRNIAISSALFKDSNGNGNAYGDSSYNMNNQPFAYVSAGTPSALNMSSGMAGAKSNNNNNILSSSFLNSAFFRSSPDPSCSNDTKASSSNNDINIDDVLASFTNNNTPNLSSNNGSSAHHHPSQTSLFTDFSAYTNFDDDDIRIPSYDFADGMSGILSKATLDQHADSAPTPSSSTSAPLSAVHSTTSNASGKSTAATSIYMTENGSMGRRRTRSDAASNGIGGGKAFEGFYPADKSLIAVPFGTPAASSDMASSATQSADGLTARAVANGASINSDDDDDDFSNLLRQSQIDADTIDYAAGNTTSTASEETTKAGDGNAGEDESLDMTGNQTLTLPTDSSSSLDFDLKLFPLPGSAETVQQKQGSQQTPLQIKTTSVLMKTNFSSVSDQSSGPSPSLSYGGSSTSNTSFDDPNAAHGLVAAAATAPLPTTPRKGKQGGSGNRDSKNLAVSIAGINDENVLPSSTTSLASFATPTQSPHGSLSSCPPTPASYKTASSLPTSPYRPRPVVHAASLAWRVPPSTMSPKSNIAIDATRSLRPSPSQTFINSDPFATPASPTRLSKLNTASSPELKRRRNIRDDRDEDEEGDVAPTGIEGRMASTQDDLALNAGQSVQANGQARPIAGRRRVAGKIVPSNTQLPQFTSNAHERRFSQPAPSVNTQTPYYSTQPLSIGQDYGMRTRQLTAPLPSPATAAYQYQQQQQHQQYIAPPAVPQQQGAVSWLSDDIVSSLFSQLSDQSYLCLMQNCGQRFSNYDAVQAHIQAHFAPQPQPVAVPMHHGQTMYARQQSGSMAHNPSGPAQPQYPMYPQQGMPRPHLQQQTVWS